MLVMTEEEFKSFVQEAVKAAAKEATKETIREEIREEIQEIIREGIRAEKLIQNERLTKEWYTLAECARLKGVSAPYLSKHPDRQPTGGKRGKTICGRKRFHISDVAPWLVADDSGRGAEEIKEKSQRTA